MQSRVFRVLTSIAGALVLQASLVSLAAAQVDASRAVSDTVSRTANDQAIRGSGRELFDRVEKPSLGVREEYRATAIGVSRNGRFAALAFSGAGVALWDMERGRELIRATLPSNALAVAAADDGSTLAAVVADGSLMLVDGAGAQPALKIDGAASALTFDPDRGTALVALRDGGLVRLDLKTKAQTRVAAPKLLALGPPEDIAAGVTADGGWFSTAGAADIKNGVRNAQAAAMAPDGASALVIDRKGQFFRVSAGQKPREIGKLPAQAALGAGPDAKAVVGLDADGRVGVFDAASGKRTARIISTRSGWVVLDEAGRFDGSRAGLAQVDWRFKDVTVPVDAFAAAYFEPGVLGRAWSGSEVRASGATRPIEAGVPPPPTVEVNLPDSEAKTGGKPYQVLAIARTRGAAVAGIRFYHNGRALPPQALVQSQDLLTKNKDEAIKAASFMITPAPGLNTFRAVAETDLGVDVLSERASATFTGDQKRGALHVLSIGVDAYGGQLPNLNYAVKDAGAIADAFKRSKAGDGPPDIVTLTNAQATRAGILKAIADLAARTKPADTVVVYMSGHGLALTAGAWAFGASGADPAKAATTLSSKDLVDALGALSAPHVTLMIDACFAGASARAFADERATFQKIASDLSRQSGFTIIAGARENAEALELPALGDGAFTYALLKGLTGGADTSPKDGVVSVLELADDVELRMAALGRLNPKARQEMRTYTIGADFPLY